MKNLHACVLSTFPCCSSNVHEPFLLYGLTKRSLTFLFHADHLFHVPPPPLFQLWTTHKESCDQDFMQRRLTDFRLDSISEKFHSVRGRFKLKGCSAQKRERSFDAGITVHKMCVTVRTEDKPSSVDCFTNLICKFCL